MSAAIYRLHTASRSGGDIQLYESWDRFAEAVLLASIEALASNHRGPREQWMASMAWFKQILKRDEDASARVTRVMACQKLEGGEWVDLDPELVPPSIKWHALPMEEDR